MADIQDQSIAVEMFASELPPGMNLFENSGNSIFRVEGNATCYLEKRFIYRVNMEGALTESEVKARLTDAVNDFIAQLGTTANVLGPRV